nr:NADH dehydrogenase subunit 6 [Petalocephala gongshanensis]
MKFLILKLIFYLVTLSSFMTNPVSMGLLLMVYSFLISFLIGKIMLTSWFCIVTMLMMIGGLLVIFMYISSISSNEKFKFNKLNFIFLFAIFFYLDELMMDYQCFDLSELGEYLDLSESFSMVKLYNSSNFLLTLFLIIYLIFTMIVVSFIVKHFKGPLRSLSYE